MVAIVHDNTQIPLIELGGMLLGPGRLHRLTYVKRVKTFLPAPYTTCTDKLNLALETMINQYNGTDYGYNQFQCFLPCIQAYT